MGGDEAEVVEKSHQEFFHEASSKAFGPCATVQVLTFACPFDLYSHFPDPATLPLFSITYSDFFRFFLLYQTIISPYLCVSLLEH